VVVFPSKLSAASALNALLADSSSPAVLSDLSMTTPTSTSSTFDSELPTAELHAVPTHLWPVTLRPVATRLRMDADDGGAPDPSDGGVMKERLGIRWARTGDKKQGRKVRACRPSSLAHASAAQADSFNLPQTNSSGFYQKYGTTAGKPKIAPEQFQEDILSSSFAFDRDSRGRGASSAGRWQTRERSASPVGRDPRTLARPMRRSASPSEDDRRGGHGRGMRSDQLADLEADLDGLSRGERGARENRPEGGRGRGERGPRRNNNNNNGGGEGGGRRTEQRPKRDADDLDRELEQFLAQRAD
jgi:hypothetical protein